MNKEAYSNSPVVIDFLNWFESIIDLPNSFCHSYICMKTNKPWNCDSIFSSYEKYFWVSTFDNTLSLLADYSAQLKAALKKNDTEACLSICISVLTWGELLKGSQERLEKLAKKGKLCDYLNDIIVLFSSDKNYNEYYSKEIFSNSGFSQIYSLLVNDFIIYDSRVAAALGLIVRKYCEAKKLSEVPVELLFAWSKGNLLPSEHDTVVNNDDDKCNPSSDDFHFPAVYGKATTHLSSNIRANWLLSKFANNTTSSFKAIPSTSRLRAIEAALFMIGYDVKGN